MTTKPKNDFPSIEWRMGDKIEVEHKRVLHEAHGQSEDGREWWGIWIEDGGCYDCIEHVEEVKSKPKNKKETRHY